MTKYKIVEETQYNGTKLYYVKVQFLWFFWKNLNSFKYGFQTAELALERIKEDKKRKSKIKGSKIKSRKTIGYV